MSYWYDTAPMFYQIHLHQTHYQLLPTTSTNLSQLGYDPEQIARILSTREDEPDNELEVNKTPWKQVKSTKRKNTPRNTNNYETNKITTNNKFNTTAKTGHNEKISNYIFLAGGDYNNKHTRWVHD